MQSCAKWKYTYINVSIYERYQLTYISSYELESAFYNLAPRPKNEIKVLFFSEKNPKFKYFNKTLT